MKDRVKREKAWIGAVIGAVTGIGGGIASGIMRRKQMKKAKSEQIRQEGYNQAANMTSQFADQDYVDDYNKKIVLKSLGGKYKTRKKFEEGGSSKINWGEELNNIGAGLTSLTNSMTQNSAKPFRSTNFKILNPKKKLEPNSYDNVNNNIGNNDMDVNDTINNIVQNKQYLDRLKYARLGTKYKKKMA